MTDEIQKDKTNSQGLLFVDRIMDTVDMTLRQFTSGRWLLTIAAGICLIHFAFTWPPEKQDKIIDIIKDIVIFYFVVRDAITPKTGGSNEKTSSTAAIPSPDVRPS